MKQPTPPPARPKRKNLGLQGSKHWKAALDEDMVRAIFAAEGKQSDIASSFGTTQKTVSNIKTGKAWAHLNLRRAA